MAPLLSVCCMISCPRIYENSESLAHPALQVSCQKMAYDLNLLKGHHSSLCQRVKYTTFSTQKERGKAWCIGSFIVSTGVKSQRKQGYKGYYRCDVSLSWRWLCDLPGGVGMLTRSDTAANIWGLAAKLEMIAWTSSGHSATTVGLASIIVITTHY